MMMSIIRLFGKVQEKNLSRPSSFAGGCPNEIVDESKFKPVATLFSLD
jgi:hypothetical protein